MFEGNFVNDLWMFLGMMVGYIILVRWVLPRLGVPT